MIHELVTITCDEPGCQSSLNGLTKETPVEPYGWVKTETGHLCNIHARAAQAQAAAANGKVSDASAQE